MTWKVLGTLAAGITAAAGIGARRHVRAGDAAATSAAAPSGGPDRGPAPDDGGQDRPHRCEHDQDGRCICPTCCD